MPILMCTKPDAIEQETVTIQGLVTDARDSTPISGAVVRIVGTDTWTETGSNGRFTLYQVPCGETAISVKKEHYAIIVKTIEVTADDPFEIRDQVLLSPDYGILSGRVIDAWLHDPLAGVTVRVQSSLDALITDSATTDSSGRYRITWLPPDTLGYRIIFAKPRYRTDTITRKLSMGDSLFARDSLDQYLTVSGTITERDTTLPVRGARIETSGRSVVSDSLGVYSFDNLLPRDTGYLFSISADYFEPATFRDTVTPDDTVVHRTSLTRKTGVIEAAVILQGQKDHSGIPVEIAPWTLRDTTDANGRIRFSGVPAGITILNAAMNGFRDLSDTVAVMGDDTVSGRFELIIESGTVVSMVDWTVDRSPYIVSDTLEVIDGGVLTIHPGAAVRLSSAARLGNSGTGRIFIRGTVGKPVRFFPRNQYSPGGNMMLSGFPFDTVMKFAIVSNVTTVINGRQIIARSVFVQDAHSAGTSHTRILNHDGLTRFIRCDFIGLSGADGSVMVHDSINGEDSGSVAFSACSFFRSGDASSSAPFVSNDAAMGAIITAFSSCNFYVAGGSPDSMFIKVNADTSRITFDDPLYNDPAKYDFRVKAASPFLRSAVPIGAMGAAGPAEVTE